MIRYSKFLYILALIASQNVRADNQESTCLIEFKTNSPVTLIDKNAVDDCLKRHSKQTIESVTVIGSASKEGSAKRNKDLAKERADAISQIVKVKFPEVPIQKITLGVNEDIGKKSKVIFVVKDEQKEKEKREAAALRKKVELLEQQLQEKEQQHQELIASQAEIQREKAADSIASKLYERHEEDLNKKDDKKDSLFLLGNPNFRVAARLGIDRTLKDYQRNFPSLGAELSWINRESNFRPEAGLKFNQSVNSIKIGDDEVNNIMNAYLFLGGGAAIDGAILGIRILVGHEWINIQSKYPEQNQFAFGGEARLGYEWKRGVSVFASYAITEHLQMVGVDFGISL